MFSRQLGKLESLQERKMGCKINHCCRLIFFINKASKNTSALFPHEIKNNVRETTVLFCSRTGRNKGGCMSSETNCRFLRQNFMQCRYKVAVRIEAVAL